MAISPPSDLVLDVIRAADPADVQAAQAKLKANKAAFAATSLAEAGAGFGAAVDIISQPATKAGLANAVEGQQTAGMPDEYRKFEASILQNFIGSMLPSDSEQVYGKGSAGEFWKSMMAEQIAESMSKTGGIGIAEQMYSQALARSEGKVVNATTDEQDRSQAMRLITDFERQVLGLSAAKES
ncbi:rod-binding protein [Rhizobium halophilum]|uniref:rod-binding protein n=1 Tax=Rhizobium halophilum TaxID=2846852 RepID=UPI001EFE8E9C|nr:rod-binding protein [Rhizobium halophilum]MCF6369570.1 rod-binding protein [Rhizobium halophilum]